EQALTSDNIRPEAARGFVYSWFVSGTLFAIGLIALASLLLRSAPRPFNWVWSLPAFLTGEPRPPTTTELLIVAVLAILLGVLHRIWVERNNRTVEVIRRELEDRWIEEWDWLVVCKQVEMTWRTAEALCVESLFLSHESAGRAGGMQEYDEGSSLG